MSEAAKHGMTVRQAARKRIPLDGADAEALEHALAMTEAERRCLKCEVRGEFRCFTCLQWFCNGHAEIHFPSQGPECLRLEQRKGEDLQAERDRLQEENERLRDLLNAPQIDTFLEAVRIEAAHQCERWGVEHDAGKTDADWFWLIGYLAGKALNKPEKRLHHIITTAAACLNWHAYVTGLRTQMRPGIDPPDPDVVPPRRTGERER